MSRVTPHQTSASRRKAQLDAARVRGRGLSRDTYHADTALRLDRAAKAWALANDEEKP